MEAAGARLHPRADATGGRTTYADPPCSPSCLGSPTTRGPRRPPIAYLRPFGLVLMAAYVVGSLFGEPPAGLHGEGLVVLLAVAVLAVCLPLAARLRPLPPGHRLAALLGVGAASIVLIVVQGEQSSAIAGLYFGAVLGAFRLPWRQALFAAGVLRDRRRARLRAGGAGRGGP